MEEKNKIVEVYIYNILNEVNKEYSGLMSDEKISRAIEMFKDSSEDLETKIKPEIRRLAAKEIKEYLEFEKKIIEMLEQDSEYQVGELATLDLNTNKNGIYLSQQQIDLLMIVDLKSKNELQEYFYNVCGQFPYRKIDDVIPGFNTMPEEELESAKKKLFEEYQDGLIGYLEYAKMSLTEKAEIKLEKLGISGEERKSCLSILSKEGVNKVYSYLGKKYGDDFITKFNLCMNDDFENIKGVSYEEIKSLSNLIKRDDSLDTVIIATGKFHNIIYSTPNGKVFDSYYNDKAAKYCFENGKHLRYHATFDHSRIDSLVETICKKHNIDLSNRTIDQLTSDEISILKSYKSEVLTEQKSFTIKSLKYVDGLNRKYPGLIKQYEVFNELVEKNKGDKNSPYEMVWEKYFGITMTDIMNCFKDEKGNFIKPAGVEFMYNETTLTESPEKRKMVEKVMFQIEKIQPGFIDSFGDQMHLSDKDVITQEGINNLEGTAQMIKRLQDGKILVDGKEEIIKPKKTECTEHDFHFSESFIKKIKVTKNNNDNVDTWKVKRKMQDTISKIYVKNGVKFAKTTYWSLFGKTDHNLVRANLKLQKNNNKDFIDTMLSGLIPDGKTFTNINTLNSIKNQNSVVSADKSPLISQHQLVNSQPVNNRKSNADLRSLKRKKERENPYEVKKKTEIEFQQINQSMQQHKQIKHKKNKQKILIKDNNENQGNKGFANVIILSLIISLVICLMLVIVYSIIK